MYVFYRKRNILINYKTAPINIISLPEVGCGGFHYGSFVTRTEEI